MCATRLSAAKRVGSVENAVDAVLFRPRMPWPTRLLCAVLVLALAPFVRAAEDPPAAPAPSAAQEAPPASAVIKRLNATLLDLMQRADELGYEGRARIVGPVVFESFDLRAMARVALGKHWRRLESAERDGFIDLLGRMSIANYASRFDGYSGERLLVVDEEDAPQGLRLVRSRIVKADGGEVKLDYRLRSVEGEWRIVDVFLNGTVSELALRRAEYTSIIERRGYPALVEAIEARIDELAQVDPRGD